MDDKVFMVFLSGIDYNMTIVYGRVPTAEARIL